MRAAKRVTYNAELSALTAGNPPPTVSAAICSTVASLETILNLPFALTHTDLSWTNILVRPETGSLCGVIDWANAAIEPFGKGLWALEHLLSFEAGPGAGWQFFDGVASYQALFAEELSIRIGVERTSSLWKGFAMAKVMGILLRYGFSYDDETVSRKVVADWSRMEMLLA